MIPKKFFDIKKVFDVKKVFDIKKKLRRVVVVSSMEGETMSFLINWSTSELNTQVNPTTCLGDTGCWIQQVTAPTLVVTCWIHQCASILHSSWTSKFVETKNQLKGTLVVWDVVKHTVGWLA